MENYLEEIRIKNLILKGDAPKIKNVEHQKSDEFEFLMDVDISFSGLIYFEIETAIHMNWPKKDSMIVPIKVKIALK